MKRFLEICKKGLYPPLWLMLILALVSTAALITVFLMGWDETAGAAVVYAISAYTLTVWCVFFVKVMPGWYRKMKQGVYDHPLGNRYMTDAQFKVQLSLYISLGINLAYSLFKLASGIYFASFWWGAIAVYYILLSIIRFLLLHYIRYDKGKGSRLAEYKRYRLCGVGLVLINLSLSGIVFQMVWQNKAYTYDEIIIIATATYTFYTVVMSIVDIVRYRKYNSPILSAAKAIRFAAALVSLLTLETAMLAQYGDDPASNRLMTAITGAGVCVIVMAMSVYMIVKATKEIRRIKEERNNL